MGGITYLDSIMLDYPGPDAESIKGQWEALEDMQATKHNLTNLTRTRTLPLTLTLTRARTQAPSPLPKPNPNPNGAGEEAHQVDLRL